MGWCRIFNLTRLEYAWQGGKSMWNRWEGEAGKLNWLQSPVRVVRLNEWDASRLGRGSFFSFKEDRRNALSPLSETLPSLSLIHI